MRPQLSVLGDETMSVSLSLKHAPSAPKRELRADAATLRLFVSLTECWCAAALRSEPAPAAEASARAAVRGTFAF